MPNLLTSDPSSMPLPGLSRSSVRVFVLLVFIPLMTNVLTGETIPLQSIVTPSTVVFKDGHPVIFAVHGFIEFKSLAELFSYIQTQTGRWKNRNDFGDTERQAMGRELLRRGIESRIISMADERPLEALVTHTRQELQEALGRVKEPVPPGYAEAFLEVQG